MTHDLSVTRLIDAPPELVWRAWTEHTADWFCPRPWTTEIRAMDLRTGGRSALVLRGPKLERDGCVAWRARDLCALVEERFGVRYGETGMLKLLKGLDLSWQKARPIHPEADLKAQERFKKTCLA